MSEQVSNSPTVALPSVEVNLTQLNAFNQYIVSRTAVMLTTGGLAAAAGGIIERLHPGVDRIAPGITPWLLYMAAAFIPMSILMDYRLQSLLTDRFREDIRLGDQIKVTKEDYENFKRSRSNKLKSLDVSFVLLLLGTTALVFHAYELYVSDNHLISRTLEAYQAMNWILIAITLIISVYAVRRLMRRLKRLSVQL